MGYLFSDRTSWDLRESTLAQSIREAYAAGRTLVDLTLSNPTVCGFEFNSEDTLHALEDSRAMRYDPDPRGLPSARESVAAYYAAHEAPVDPDHILLTTSTSEAYSFLFRLLCNSGDAVLVAQPSYPLFDFIAALDDVTIHTYPLFPDFGWWIDFAELERRITSRTRAIILVHPNNPTGHATMQPERNRLEALCVQHHLALIVDEVFLDYGLNTPVESFSKGSHPCLTFVLSGLSKVVALPQMKVAWIACFGPSAERRTALSRLEMIADTFLSVAAPAQHALQRWLEHRSSIQDQILTRIRQNLAVLNGEGISMFPVNAGWSAILRLPHGINPTEDPALSLLEGPGLIVHPGSFYGLAGSRYIVVSLIGPCGLMKAAAGKLNAWCEPNELT